MAIFPATGYGLCKHRPGPRATRALPPGMIANGVGPGSFVDDPRRCQTGVESPSTLAVYFNSLRNTNKKGEVS